MESEIICRDILELVGFVEDDCAVIGKNRGYLGFPNGKIGEEEMMIHDNNVGLHCLLPHEREEAAIIVFALCSQAPVPSRIQPRPQIRIITDGTKLCPIARFCFTGPIHDGLEGSKFLWTE